MIYPPRLRLLGGLLLALVVMIGLISTTAQTTMSQTGTPASACHTLYHWRLNPETWPVSELTLGGQVYTREELVALLNTQIREDISLDLLKQVVTAKLNITAGCGTPEAEALIANSDALLAARAERLPLGITQDTAEGQQIVGLLPALKAYNDSVSPSDPTVSVVIEGPIQSINGSVITIYDIEIELDPREPMLQVLQVGEVLRIEGAYAQDNQGQHDDDDDDRGTTPAATNTIAPNVTIVTATPTHTTTPAATNTALPATATLTPAVTVVTNTPAATATTATAAPGGTLTATPERTPQPGVIIIRPRLRLIAIIIIIVRGDFYVYIDGRVYQERFECNTRPPDWAPAWGWRRRCESPTIIIGPPPVDGGAIIIIEPPSTGGGGGNDGGMGMGMGDDDDD